MLITLTPSAQIGRPQRPLPQFTHWKFERLDDQLDRRVGSR